MSEISLILISAMLVNNFTLAQFLGLCPFMGVSGRVETALRMGLANIFVLVLTSISAWFLQSFVLQYAPFLKTISFIVVIASLVQLVEMIIKKFSPTLFRQLGIYLPLITTNCAILGLAINQTSPSKNYGFLEGISYALGAGLGLTLALVLMASIREEADLAPVPRIARGMGLVLIIAGSMSLAFMGFSGLFTTAAG